MFLVIDGEIKAEAEFDSYRGFRGRPGTTREPTFGFSLPTGGEASIYQQVVDQPLVLRVMAPQIESSSAFVTRHQFEGYLYAMLQGVMLGLFLYHVVVFMAIRDPSYLGYSLFLFT